MIEVYEGEVEQRIIVDEDYDIVSVTGFHTLYDDAGLPVEEDYALAYTEAPYGTGQKEVTIDISELSQWPTPFRVELVCDELGTERVVKTFSDVVTPYVSVEEIALAAKIDMEDQDSPNYHSYQEVREMESVARHVIESYTGRYFGRKYLKWTFDGTDVDHLYSDEHVSWVGLVLHDDDVIYSSTIGDYVVSPSGHTLKVFDDDGYAYGFPEKYDYHVVGIFGERSVPQDVKLAAKQLAVSYLCGDAAQKQNYIDQVKFGESQTRTNRLAFVGTGLRTVDLILDKYRFHSYRVL